jgi:segregation and condensation protein B
MTDAELKAVLEALIYVAEEPITEDTLLDLFGKENREKLRQLLTALMAEYQLPERGLEIREVANGYRMSTKAEHHEWVRNYVKIQTPPMRLSLAALETLAVIAYRQPLTLPEIQDVRGVNATGVVKTLIDRKLVTTAGRKNVVGRPILYRTAKEFLLHFGLKNLNELPSLEEFEELAKSEFGGVSSEEAIQTGPEAQTDSNPGESQLPLGIETENSNTLILGEDTATTAEIDREKLGDTLVLGVLEDFKPELPQATFADNDKPDESILESLKVEVAHQDDRPENPGSLDDQEIESGKEIEQPLRENEVQKDKSGIDVEPSQDHAISTETEKRIPIETEPEE